MTTPIQDGNLGVTLATWLYQLFDIGFGLQHDGIRAVCQAIHDLPEGGSPDPLGLKLVAAIREGIGTAAVRAP